MIESKEELFLIENGWTDKYFKGEDSGKIINLPMILKKYEISLVKKLTIHVVSQQRELLLAYEQSKCPETWWMSKNQAENEVNDFIANNCG